MGLELTLSSGRRTILLLTSREYVVDIVFSDLRISKPVSNTSAQNALGLGWAVSGPRATCGPPQRFQWPAEAFRKNHQVWNFHQLTTVNVSVQANLAETCFYFRWNSVSQHFRYNSISQPEVAKFFRVRNDFNVTICLTCRFCLNTKRKNLAIAMNLLLGSACLLRTP